jgi:hypothetical protein
MKLFTQLFSKNRSEKKHIERVSAHNSYKPQVVMGWDDHPIVLLEDGTVFPREIEMIENGKYYPNGKIGEWLCDPITGEKIPIAGKILYKQLELKQSKIISILFFLMVF